MRTNYAGLFLLFILAALTRAETIEGIVVIKSRLTPRRVTATVPIYSRGPAVGLHAVGLHKDATEDPLAFERARVAVYLEGPTPALAAVSTAPIAKLEQENRAFTPDTLVVAAGSKVSFPNQDPIFHNVFSLSKPKSFDLGSYPKGETRTVTFNQPGIVYVNCRLHPNMTASIVVTPNQWNARVGQDGRFLLSEVPPGTYTIVAWHKAAGFFRQPVEVLPGRTSHVEFLVPVELDGTMIESHLHPPKR